MLRGRGPRRSPRAGAKRTLMDTIRQLPHYFKLLAGLITDRRVSRLDKALVAGALLYLITPIDLIPDFIPFLGQVDDIFLIVTALKRLIARAGDSVVAEHWQGDPEELSDMNMDRVVGAAALFLPLRMRRNLRGLLSVGRGMVRR